jgi:hypothetical protein
VNQKTLAAATAIAFTVAFFAFAFFFLRMSILWDADSYYHLAVARHYTQHGIGAPVPWGRFSLFAAGGDKELLFHVVLMPFTTWFDPATGGRIALALFNAALFAAIANLSARAIGVGGFLVPLWLWVAVPPLFARAVRLRPELMALLLILIAIPFAARRRWIVLGVLALVFTYAYTAWHVFLALCFVWAYLNGRERNGFLYPLGGTLAALFLRSSPVETLKIWYVQNILYFFEKSRLDVGNEIRPPTGQTILVVLPWAAAILAMRFLRRREEPHPLAAAALVPASLFLLLFAFMSRMSLYAFPLVTIAVVLALKPRWLPLIAVISALIVLPLAAHPALMKILRGTISEAEWRAFGRAVPPGAKIAARWGDAELYAFAAPQGRYLNVLDPIFMALPHPREYAAQRALFDGSDPDPATTAKKVLGSDFLAFDWTDAAPELIERTRSDPRFRVRYGGYNVLLEIVPAPGVTFLDLSRARCGTWSHNETRGGTFLLAPYGPAIVALDRQVVARVPGVHAIVGRGTRLSIPEGEHRIDVHTCRDGAWSGFYLLRLE